MLEAWFLRTAEVRERDEALRERIRNLPDHARKKFFKDYNLKIKDPDTYAVLNWFFLAGLHHFYLGNLMAGTFNLLIMVTGIVQLFQNPPIGITLIGLILLLEVPALFRSQVIVANHNVNLGGRLLLRHEKSSPK